MAGLLPTYVTGERPVLPRGEPISKDTWNWVAESRGLRQKPTLEILRVTWSPERELKRRPETTAGKDYKALVLAHQLKSAPRYSWSTAISSSRESVPTSMECEPSSKTVVGSETFLTQEYPIKGYEWVKSDSPILSECARHPPEFFGTGDPPVLGRLGPPVLRRQNAVADWTTFTGILDRSGGMDTMDTESVSSTTSDQTIGSSTTSYECSTGIPFGLKSRGATGSSSQE